MFKNNKDKLSVEELEKMYKFQQKEFDAKIAEHAQKIEEITNYISARFGEDIADSNVETKLKNLEKSIQEIEIKNKTNLEKNKKALKKEIEHETKKIATELNDAQTESYFKLLQKNENDLEKLKEFISKEKNYEKIINFDIDFREHIKDEEKYRQEIEKELKDTNQQISKINYIGKTNKVDKKLKEKFGILDEKIVNTKGQVDLEIANLDEKFTEKVGQVQENLHINSEQLIKLQEMFVNTNDEIVRNVENKIIALDEKMTDKIEKNQVITCDLDTKFSKEIKSLNENIKTTKKDFKTIILKEIGNVSGNVQAAIKSASELEEKIKLTEEKIESIQDENKVELENITKAIEDVKTEIGDTITAIEEEISKFKEETKVNLQKNQENDDIELFKKDYNKYIAKVNNELSKINKELLNVQKKSLEQNKNLQVKIKAYIDAKVDKTNDLQNIKELIDNLKLSMLEREKIQKNAMEELLNKKMKAIQKENEKLINKKIEEMASRLIRENAAKTEPKTNNINIYQGEPKKKKNMYELIDEKEMLKRSASSKNPKIQTKEGRSQILKFFYDEED